MNQFFSEIRFISHAYSCHKQECNVSFLFVGYLFLCPYALSSMYRISFGINIHIFCLHVYLDALLFTQEIPQTARRILLVLYKYFLIFNYYHKFDHLHPTLAFKNVIANMKAFYIYFRSIMSVRCPFG